LQSSGLTAGPFSAPVPFLLHLNQQDGKRRRRPER
jgi:hypothetical protein